MPDPFAVANSIFSDLIFLDFSDTGAVTSLTALLRTLGTEFTGPAAQLATQAADALAGEGTEDERRNQAAGLLERCLQAAEAATTTPLPPSEVILPGRDPALLDFLDRAEATVRELDPRLNLAAYRRKLHTLKGDAGVVGLRDEARVCHAMEDLLAQGTPPAQLDQALRWLTERFAAHRLGLTPSTAEIFLAHLKRPPLGETLVASGLVDQEIVTAALAQQAHLTPGRPLGEILVDAGQLDQRRLEAILGGPVHIPVRIDGERLEAWDAAWGSLHRLLDRLPVGPAERRRLHRAQLQLQAARDQLTTTTARGLLERLARVAQDTARTLGIDVALDLAGGGTALERHAAERLAEALPHIVRNALGHGLETADERRRAGKPATGTVAIRIQPRGRGAAIEIRDDGRGIDAAKVLARADLPPDTPVDGPTLWRLISRPGLSTADQVTALSGRGIGLDVVADLEVSLGATITLESAPGRGTTFLILIPPADANS